MKRLLFPIAVAVSLCAFASPGYDKLVVSNAKGGPAMERFKPDTPKVFVYGSLRDMADGTVLRADWIAEKVEGAPPNYKIDSTQLKANKRSSEFNFSFSKPTAGWPVGTYRVELYMNGELAKKVPFSVAK